VNGDNNQHARDDLRMGHFITGTEAILALLSTPFCNSGAGGCHR